MQKNATTDYPIHPLLSARWSPRAFSSRPVELESLHSLFEAARWSPSGRNRQPWSFILTGPATPQAYAGLLSTLNESNQAWACLAPVLVLTILKCDREPGDPNPYAGYDLGQSVAYLTFQAGALGLSVCQIAGFDKQQAAALFDLPAGYDPMTVLAIGYAADPSTLPADLLEREMKPRTRKPQSEFVFNGAWQVPLTPLAEEQKQTNN